MRIAIHPDILLQQVQGEAVLLSIDQEKYYGLNEVGTLAWKYLTDTGILEDAVQGILGEYQVDATSSTTVLRAKSKPEPASRLDRNPHAKQLLGGCRYASRCTCSTCRAEARGTCLRFGRPQLRSTGQRRRVQALIVRRTSLRHVHVARLGLRVQDPVLHRLFVHDSRPQSLPECKLVPRPVSVQQHAQQEDIGPTSIRECGSACYGHRGSHTADGPGMGTAEGDAARGSSNKCWRCRRTTRVRRQGWR
ncbi:MAG: PqqD family protein [Polyangiaceae bacterium]|nr:PqqD family protein [Polyangiaceae bacterium]